MVPRISAAAAALFSIAAFLAAPSRAAPPAPGGAGERAYSDTECFIRLGPQALLYRDREGNLSMVDEPPPQAPELNAAGALVGAFLGAALGTFIADPRRVLPGITYGMAAGSAESDLFSTDDSEGRESESLRLCRPSRRVR